MTGHDEILRSLRWWTAETIEGADWREIMVEAKVERDSVPWCRVLIQDHETADPAQLWMLLGQMQQDVIALAMGGVRAPEVVQ